jgi:hypothetical protein
MRRSMLICGILLVGALSIPAVLWAQQGDSDAEAVYAPAVGKHVPRGAGAGSSSKKKSGRNFIGWLFGGDALSEGGNSDSDALPPGSYVDRSHSHQHRRIGAQNARPAESNDGDEVFIPSPRASNKQAATAGGRTAPGRIEPSNLPKPPPDLGDASLSRRDRTPIPSLELGQPPAPIQTPAEAISKVANSSRRSDRRLTESGTPSASRAGAASRGPTGSGPTGSGPTGSGPTGSGPTGSGPASSDTGTRLAARGDKLPPGTLQRVPSNDGNDEPIVADTTDLPTSSEPRVARRPIPSKNRGDAQESSDGEAAGNKSRGTSSNAGEDPPTLGGSKPRRIENRSNSEAVGNLVKPRGGTYSVPGRNQEDETTRDAAAQENIAKDNPTAKTNTASKSNKSSTSNQPSSNQPSSKRSQAGQTNRSAEEDAREDSFSSRTAKSKALNSSATDSDSSSDRSRGSQQPSNQPRSGAANSDSSTASADGKPVGGRSGKSGGAGTRPTESEIEPIVTQIPAIRVEARGPKSVPINRSFQYELLVQNLSESESPGVVITGELPASVQVQGQQATRGDAEVEKGQGKQLLLWQLDRLPAGGSERLTMRMVASTPEDFDVAVEWTVMPQTSVARVNVQQPKLELFIEGADRVTYGSTEVYKVRVKNPGTGLAEGVVFTLSPKSATPQSQQLGDIAAGREASFEIELTARDLEDLEIHGLVSAGNDLRHETIKKVTVAAAQLEATLDGPASEYQGNEATYRLVLINQGNAASDDVDASLRLPPGVEYLGGLDDAQQDGDRLRWTIKSLAAGKEETFELQCRMTETGAHVLAFDCQGTAAGEAEVSLTTSVEAMADLTLAINDPPAPAAVGNEVRYELVITNRGAKAASAVNVSTVFSDGIEPIRCEGAAGSVDVGKANFEPISRIEAGQTMTLVVIAKANVPGNHRFRAEVTCGETSLVSEEATKYITTASERISRSSKDNARR